MEIGNDAFGVGVRYAVGVVAPALHGARHLRAPCAQRWHAVAERAFSHDTYRWEGEIGEDSKKSCILCIRYKSNEREREREEDETIRVIDLTILVEHNLFVFENNMDTHERLIR